MRSIDEVHALAASKSVLASARKLADPSAWRRLAREGDALWGVARGSEGDHHAVYVTSGGPEALRCSCPSRTRPCKHALALALLDASGHVFEPGTLPPGHRYA